jgi:chromosome segregation ATPase
MTNIHSVLYYRRDLEETYQVLERMKADLANTEKLHMDAIHVIESKETTIKNLSNALDKTREEKMSLEELENTLKTVLIEKDKKIESLDKTMAETKNKLTNEAAALKDKLIRYALDSTYVLQKIISIL